MRWQDTLETLPELRDIGNWPKIAEAALDEPRTRSGFHANYRLMGEVLQSDKISVVAARYDTTKHYIYRLLKRTLSHGEGEEPALTVGLIPHARIRPNRRRIALPSHPGEGCACAFTSLIEQTPGLSSHLDEIILKDLRRDRDAERLTPKGFHKSLKTFLLNLGFTSSQYPFNTDSEGRESVRRYFKKRRAEIRRLRARHSPNRSRTTSSLNKVAPYDNWDFDAHAEDVELSLLLDVGELQPVPLRVSRLQLLLAIDRCSEAVMGYSVAFAHTSNQDEIASCFAMCLAPAPQERIPDYLIECLVPGAGIPAADIAGCRGALPSMISLDNAWAHFGRRLQYQLVSKLGITLNNGLPAFPNARHLVEKFFDLVADLEHRMPSTTGSHPRDSSKEERKNRRLPPVVSVEDFHQLLYITIANYNGTPRAERQHRSPMSIIENAVSTGTVLLRYAPDSMMSM